jgi:hypothetical protein
MSVALITGAHQSGKTRRAWEVLRACPLGSAVLVTPQGHLSREMVRSWHAAFGAGMLPMTVSLDALFSSVAGSALGSSSATLGAHLVRRFCAEGALDDTPLQSIARFRATARDLSDSCLRMDAFRIGEDELSLAVRTLRRQDDRLARKLQAINAISRRLAHAGVRSRARVLGDIGAAPSVHCRWATLVCDDLISLSPAELQVLRGLAATCQVVLTAVADLRLQSGSLLERLRTAFPEASEEHLGQVHVHSPHRPAMRAVVQGVLTGKALPADAVNFYHYRDETHAGRAISAWMRRHGVAPGAATLYLRTSGEEGLAVADALLACGVPVRGSFTVPMGSSSLGGLARALGRWCDSDSWGNFLAVCERLALAPTAEGAAPADASGTPAREPPVPPRQLRGPWAAQPAGAALERLESLARHAPCDGFDWQEPQRGQPTLRAAITWYSGWLTVLQLRSGTWLERFQELARRLALALPAEVWLTLSELQEHAAVGAWELEELLSAQSVTIQRGGELEESSALQVSDAVRGRSELRAVAILHGLEHGRWPAAPRRGACLSRDERTRISAALDGRDPWDEAGQTSGETAAFLAVIARATEQILCGIPCGERVPSPFLGALTAQLGVDLVGERGKSAMDAVPGAPLGEHDSQGAAEQALWGQPIRRPDFRFVLPRREAAALGLSASRLNDLLCDPFACVLGTLGLEPPLSSIQRRRDGQELHDLLALLGGQSPQGWGVLVEDLLSRWVAQGADHLAVSARARSRPEILRALGAEIQLAQGCTVVTEAPLEITIPDAAGGVLLQLRGKADRLDRSPDGLIRIVDYKFSVVGHYRELVRDQHEGQLAAYAAGVAGQGLAVGGAYYRALLDGDAAGYLGPSSPAKMGTTAIPVAELPGQLIRIAQAIQALCEGHAATDPEQGLCAVRGYAPLARLDEARLQLSADADASDGHGSGDGHAEGVA